MRLGLWRPAPPVPALRTLPGYSWQARGDGHGPAPAQSASFHPTPLASRPAPVAGFQSPRPVPLHVHARQGGRPGLGMASIAAGVRPSRVGGTPAPQARRGDRTLVVEAADILSEEPGLYEDDDLTVVQVAPGFAHMKELFPGDESF